MRVSIPVSVSVSVSLSLSRCFYLSVSLALALSSKPPCLSQVDGQMHARSMSPLSLAQRRREPGGQMHQRSRRLAALAPSGSSSALLGSLRLSLSLSLSLFSNPPYLSQVVGQIHDRSMSPLSLAQRRREPDGQMHHRSRRLAALAPSSASS